MENEIKINIIDKIKEEGFLKDINNKNKITAYSGIYFIYDDKNLYIGKSKDIVNRLMTHKTKIKNKNHYNTKMNNFKINKLKYIYLECKNIDIKERYYINKFKKIFKLFNLIFPKYNSDISFYDIQLKPRIRKLNYKNKKILNWYMYANKVQNIREEKLNLLPYFELINGIGTILRVEYSKATRMLYFKIKELNKTIGITRNNKVIKTINKEIILSNLSNKYNCKLGFVII